MQRNACPKLHPNANARSHKTGAKMSKKGNEHRRNLKVTSSKSLSNIC